MFADLRTSPPSMPDGLLDRVTVDALRAMPSVEATPYWRQIVAALGGWPALAGLAATACVGVWVGGVASDELLMGIGLTQNDALVFGDASGVFDALLVDG